jgi:hypothetical protein
MKLGSYLVLLSEETVENDFDVRDLEATKAISFRLTLRALVALGRQCSNS